MKSYSKLPLYLGLFVLVLSVLVSAVKVGEKQMIASQGARAKAGGASLSLNFSAPDLVGISLVSDKIIAGVDIVIKFDKNKVNILPSTLSGGSSFITSGGIIDEESGTFSFSALAKEEKLISPIVATFHVVPLVKSGSVESDMEFVDDEGKTQVLEKSTVSNILGTTTGVKFNLSAK